MAGGKQRLPPSRTRSSDSHLADAQLEITRSRCVKESKFSIKKIDDNRENLSATAGKEASPLTFYKQLRVFTCSQFSHEKWGFPPTYSVIVYSLFQKLSEWYLKTFHLDPKGLGGFYFWSRSGKKHF